LLLRDSGAGAFERGWAAGAPPSPRRAPALRPRAWAADFGDAQVPVRPPPRAAPPPLARAPSSSADTTLLFLRNLHNGAEVFVVGTAHVGTGSARQVVETISAVRPSSVFLELCPARAARLAAAPGGDAEWLHGALAALAAAPGGRAAAALALAGFYRLLRAAGLEVAGEFSAAVDAAQKSGARLVYGDRDVDETLAALAGAATPAALWRLATGGGGAPAPAGGAPPPPPGAGLDATVEAMRTRATARALAARLRAASPELAAALLDERDAHMAAGLARLRGRVVGVVGLAHLDGLEAAWLAPGGAGSLAPARR
jgi:pheromone shutdown protein TraB